MPPDILRHMDIETERPADIAILILFFDLGLGVVEEFRQVNRFNLGVRVNHHNHIFSRRSAIFLNHGPCLPEGLEGSDGGIGRTDEQTRALIRQPHQIQVKIIRQFLHMWFSVPLHPMIHFQRALFLRVFPGRIEMLVQAQKAGPLFDALRSDGLAG